MDYQSSTLPDIADCIEVLWLMEDEEEYWWKAKVLQIMSIDKRGGIIASALIQYEPGPGVDVFTDYSVKILEDSYLYHVGKNLQGLIEKIHGVW